ncbi:hypothetical protein [Mycobacterium sp. NPDC050041]|uniref:hypothetical protein n=1 Tax=Mycobacterium sp. NPDC050041 TaxID=3364293 RepID=UPI003C2C8B61
MAEMSSSARLRCGTVGALLCLAAAAGATWPAATAIAQPESEFTTDERGFVDTAAHCQGAAVAVAYGRTAESLVAICAGAGGQLQFRGVRLEDDAALMLAAEPTTGGYVAVNDGVTYTVTPTALTVASGVDTVIRQPMVDYRGAGQPG